MEIYFVRHGESQANILHEISNRGLRHGLTRRGRDQAAKLAQSLLEKSITHIYSSPLLRALETSIILAHELNLNYEVVDALREYDCGVAEGRADEASWQQWQAFFDAWLAQQQWDRGIEGGETFLDIRNRFVPFIDGLIYRFGGTGAKILCVAHGGLYWMMLPLVLNNVDVQTISSYGLHYTTCIVSEHRPEGLFCVEWGGTSLDIPPI